ncbi:hypothetical protein AWV80_05815 [Cupriavidus sp. UYMU48A]|nr:hypothetical protein AWV80_05815 [Cupriavidus sp. UYMU48A]
MVYHQSLLLTAWAVFAAFFAYPLLFWFLRRVKRVPLRFNVTTLAAVVAAGLLPVEFEGLEASRKLLQATSMSALLSAERRVHDTLLLCAADPSKVPPGRILAAKRRLADSGGMWTKPSDMSEITTAQWLELDSKCDGWLPSKNPLSVQVQEAAVVTQRWMSASLATGAVGMMALYALVFGRLRQDMREVQVEGRVELRTYGERLLALFIWVIAYSPFVLLWLGLFKVSKSAARKSRATV